jgi:hypothetical protein
MARAILMGDSQRLNAPKNQLSEQLLKLTMNET